MSFLEGFEKQAISYNFAMKRIFGHAGKNAKNPKLAKDLKRRMINNLEAGATGTASKGPMLVGREHVKNMARNSRANPKKFLRETDKELKKLKYM